MTTDTVFNYSRRRAAFAYLHPTSPLNRRDRWDHSRWTKMMKMKKNSLRTLVIANFTAMKWDNCHRHAVTHSWERPIKITLVFRICATAFLPSMYVFSTLDISHPSIYSSCVDIPDKNIGNIQQKINRKDNRKGLKSEKPTTRSSEILEQPPDRRSRG